MPEPFLAILSYNPPEVAWCSSSQVSHAFWEGKAIIGRSGSLLTILPLDYSRRGEPVGREALEDAVIATPLLLCTRARLCFESTGLPTCSQVENTGCMISLRRRLTFLFPEGTLPFD